MTATPQEVLTFWRDAGYDRWFTKTTEFDTAVRERFFATYEAAAAGGLRDWENSADGALALIIVLDQFPRNLFRGTARAFATDAMARTIAQQAIARGDDRHVDPDLRNFFYMPLMHSEDFADQDRCVAYFRTIGGVQLPFAEMHADIIRRFGRFPHRNALLGRPSTPAEEAFLDGSGFQG